MLGNLQLCLHTHLVSSSCRGTTHPCNVLHKLCMQALGIATGRAIPFLDHWKARTYQQNCCCSRDRSCTSSSDQIRDDVCLQQGASSPTKVAWSRAAFKVRIEAEARGFHTALFGDLSAEPSTQLSASTGLSRSCAKAGMSSNCQEELTLNKAARDQQQSVNQDRALPNC